jgi:hypothetical protein
MKISKQKEIILDILNPYFRDNNIKGKDIWQLRYEFNKSIYGSELKCSLSFSNYGEPTGFAYALTINSVEQIIMDIQFPYHNFSDYEKGELPFNTIKGSGFSMTTSISNDSIIEFSNSIINYLETSVKDFIDTYSYLPNILKKMDQLEAEGKYWNEILAGGPEFLLRGLIISKLCNDKNYGNKLEYVKELYISMADEYLPYYEKLKERLKTVEPIYNL